MSQAEQLAAARSFLFVPGHRPDRFARALASPADYVVADLEDAVPAQAKVAAREHVADLVSRTTADRAVIVRVNHPDTAWGRDDMTALAALAAAPGLAAVMVPKVDGPDMLARVRSQLGDRVDLLPLVESAAALLAAATVASAPGVIRLAFGHLDLGAELGIDPADRALLAPARHAIVVASAAAGIAAPIDGVTPNFRALDLAGADTRAALTAGFTARLCIHPDQVDVVHEALAPTEAELAWARSVLCADRGEGVAESGGQMVDRPVLLRARAITARVPSTTRENQ